MRNYSIILCFLLIGCGSKQAVKKEAPVPKVENKMVEFQFNRGLKDYMGQTIAITGFIWKDSIGEFLTKGNYIIFERPNCFECSEIMSEAKTDISVVKLEDTSFVNPYKDWNWRLVKISGVVTNEQQLSIDRIEQSEYSYPDYENSGFIPVTNEYLQFHANDKDLVYMDACINPKADGYSEEIYLLKLEKTRLDATGFAILHNGDAPNMAHQIEGPTNMVITEVKDMNGMVIGKKKVRIYGVLDFDKTKPKNYTIQVEAIEIQE